MPKKVTMRTWVQRMRIHHLNRHKLRRSLVDFDPQPCYIQSSLSSSEQSMKSPTKFAPATSYLKTLTILLFCAAIGYVCVLSADPDTLPHWQVTPDLEVTKLQPGVWVHTSWYTFENGARFPSNGLIIMEDDSLLLIDTAWGERATEDLLTWIEQELAVPVEAVIATHAHADRMGGAETLKTRGIPLYANPLGFEMAVDHGWPQPQSIGDLNPGDTVPFGSVEVFYPGPAHTTDNLMVWLPESRLLFGGCAVKSANSKTMGNVADADLDAWPDSIERARTTYPDTELVLPGHGAVGGQELLLHTIRLLEETK